MSIDIATLINPIPNIMGNLLNNYKKCYFLLSPVKDFKNCIPKLESMELDEHIVEELLCLAKQPSLMSSRHLSYVKHKDTYLYIYIYIYIYIYTVEAVTQPF